MKNNLAERFPKVGCPYKRKENTGGHYVVNPEGDFIGIKDRFDWVFKYATNVEAVEKLDGTNMAIHISERGDGGLYVDDVATRIGDKSMSSVEPFGSKTNHHYISQCVQNSIQRGYIRFLKDNYGTGWFFGEGIGPKFQGNPHSIDERLFVPFDWAREKLEYESYGKYSTEPESIKEWFKGSDNGLFSLLSYHMHGESPVKSRPENGCFVEGIIFIHPDHDEPIRPKDLSTDKDGQINEIAKLRRDMWEEFASNDWPMTKYGHN